MKKKITAWFGYALLGCATLTSAASAQTASSADQWPMRTTTWVVGYAPGGTTDIIARILTSALSEQTGQTFVVENRTGANSNIGAEWVKRAAPDGYMFYVGSTANAINRTLYTNLDYDIARDFASIGLLGTVPNMLVVNPKLPINSVAEYIAYAKANPGKLTCASSGAGSAIHMSCELFKIQTRTDVLHVPYRGSGPAMTDLLGGQVDSIFDNMPTVLPNVRAGKLRALGVTTTNRSTSAPDIPTLSESGLPDFSVQSWFGLFAPKGIDPAVAAKMNRAINEALASAKVKASFEKSGIALPETPNTASNFAGFVQSEVTKWGEVVTQSGAKAQ